MKFLFIKRKMVSLLLLFGASILIYWFMFKKNKEGLRFVYDHDTVSDIGTAVGGGAAAAGASPGLGPTDPGNGDQSLTAVINNRNDGVDTSAPDYFLDKNKLPNKDIFYNFRWLFEYQI
jgi:hypothetical protein